MMDVNEIFSRKRFPRWLAIAALTAGLAGQAMVAPAHAAAPAIATAASQRAETAVTTPLGKMAIPILFGMAPPEAAAATPAAAPAPAPAEAKSAEAQPAAAPAPAPAEAKAAEAQPAPAPQPKGKLVFIDPGHGGGDTGATHQDASGQLDLKESDANYGIAQRLADMLRQDGYDVQIDRSADSTPAPGQSTVADLQARVDMADNAGANLFIAIHNNGSANSSLRGTEVYYCSDRPHSADNERLARLVDGSIVGNLRQAGYDTPDRGAKDDSYIGHYAVLAPANLDRPTNMPAIIGESLFLSNDQDASQLKRPEIQDAIARGYFQGIQAYFGQAQ